MRTAGSEDAAALAALHRDSLLQHWQEGEFRAWIARTDYRLLLVEKDALVGYVMARVVAPEAEVIALAVDVAHRRSGIARSLMDALIDTLEAEGATRLFLEVSVQNTPAQALYTSLGFTDIGVRKAYYTDGTDARVMERVLGGA